MPVNRKNKSKKEDSGKPSTPDYIVTFSDMVTLLLTFFVLLLSFATDQDPALVKEGRESFVASLERLGLPAMTGMKKEVELRNRQQRYKIKNPDQNQEQQLVNANEEELKKRFRKLTELCQPLPAQITGKRINFTVTEIHFSSGKYQLDKEDKKHLDEFCVNLQQEVGPEPVKVYVLGLANDTTGKHQQWLISAKRAQAVADYIEEKIGQVANLSIHCWGAGWGGNWVGPNRPASEDTQILLSVIR